MSLPDLKKPLILGQFGATNEPRSVVSRKLIIIIIGNFKTVREVLKFYKGRRPTVSDGRKLKFEVSTKPVLPNETVKISKDRYPFY